MFRTLPQPRGARWSGLRGWNRKVARGLRSTKAQYPLKNRSIPNPNTNETSLSHRQLSTVCPISKLPSFQLSVFPPSGLKLLPPNFRLRTRTCERCNACNKRPSASSPMWFQAMDNSAETSGQRSIKIWKMTWLNSVFTSSPSHFHHVVCKVYQWAFSDK